MLHIFTDGACPNNGYAAARAASAIVFWNLEEKPFGIAEAVPLGEPQTNQRAELKAMVLAFQEIEKRGLKGPITIWTDSEQTRQCITTWGPQWKARGWKRAMNPKKPIEHLDIIKYLVNFQNENQHFIRIQHVAAHSKKTEFPWCGNQMADALAVGAVITVRPLNG